MNEYIDVLREIWTNEKPSYDGKFASFSGIQVRPLPTSKRTRPIIVGGMSPAAHRRAVTKGNGWFGFFRALKKPGTCSGALKRWPNGWNDPRHWVSLKSLSARRVPRVRTWFAVSKIWRLIA